MQNDLNSIGDVVVFKADPIFGLTSLTAFTDSITGLTLTRTVDKQYSYSLDGVIFTDWKELNANIDLVNDINPLIINITSLVVKVRYERTGTDTTGVITINSMTLTGVYNPDVPVFPISDSTVFKDLVYDNLEVFELMVNLTQKMRELGIVPSYIERNDNPNDLFDDKDYVGFWSSVAKMYSVLFEFGIQYTTIYWNLDLLTEFLKQKTIIFCKDSDITLLQLLAKNYYDEIRQRGTPEIFRRKGWHYPFGSRNAYDLTTGFSISEYNPIYIDDIAYFDVDDLPFGWTISNDQLIAPDVNYYNIQIIEPTIEASLVITPDFDYSIIDTLERIKLDVANVVAPTHYSGVKKKCSGEYLRLICNSPTCDEFMFNLVNIQNRGWTIGRSSPMYRGLRQHENTTIIKGYENFSNQVWDLSYYPIIPSGIPVDTFRIMWDNTGLMLDGITAGEYILHD